MHIAVDFGGTTIKIGLVTKGKIVSRTSVPAHSQTGLLQRLPAVESAIHEMLSQNKVRLADCTGIGIATPGLVDTTNRMILSINDKYSDVIGFQFQDWIDEKFGLPFILENDARAALVGENAYGAVQGETDVVLMTFGTGIGTAAIIGGRVLRGRHFQAGILGGHLSTNIYGQVCNCGNRGCLEAQSSKWVLGQIVREHPRFPESALAKEQDIHYLSIINAVKLQDAVAIEIFDHLIAHWSAGIVNLIHAYDPDVVVLSGGLMKSKDEIVPLLQERVHRVAWTPWGNVRFVTAEDPDSSVLLGVSRLLNMEPA